MAELGCGEKGKKKGFIFMPIIYFASFFFFFTKLKQEL